MRNKNACVSDPNDFRTNPGDRYHVTYSPIVNNDGTITLVESGKDDIQEMINSFRDSTDMSFILSRMAIGDTSVLTDKTPMYGDFTQFPKTYAGALQLVIDAENQFNSLPLDVRNKFDNDFRRWFATAGTEEWTKSMDSVIIKDKDYVVTEGPGDIIVEEVQTNES